MNIPSFDSPYQFKRNELPQIKPDVFEEFLEDFDISYYIGDVDPNDLLPIQCEFSEEKIKAMQERMLRGDDMQGTIIISDDGFVIDGHHRWLANMFNKTMVRAIVLDIGVEKAIYSVREFNKSTSEGI